MIARILGLGLLGLAAGTVLGVVLLERGPGLEPAVVICASIGAGLGMAAARIRSASQPASRTD